METVLVVDDEADLCRTIEKVLTKEGYRVFWATNPISGLDLIRKESPSCLLLDLKLGDADGLDVLAEVREYDSHLPVIMLTAYETVKTAVLAMKRGAFHYMSKPFDNEELMILIQKAIEQRNLHRQIDDLKAQVGKVDDLETFMGSSQKIQEVIKLVRSVAGTDVNVLLLGESGTGKELVAKTIHRLSKRLSGPFVPVDCAAIPETLIESELFGHEKGAFTGATSTQKGKFELACGGTLFLDEVGNIPATVQSKLLRVLETHEIERIGGKRPIQANVRVIAATNADLTGSLQEKIFRLDLFYRLNEFPIQLPSLRERKEDIPFLCQRFLLQFGPEMGKEGVEMASEALDRLCTYHYPGNVRELRNILKRGLVMANGRVELSDLPVEVRNLEKRSYTQEIKIPISYGLPLLEISKQAASQVEKRLILDALRRTEGHQGKAAQILGIGQKTLYNKMREFGICNSLNPEVPPPLKKISDALHSLQ